MNTWHMAVATIAVLWFVRAILRMRERAREAQSRRRRSKFYTQQQLRSIDDERERKRSARNA